MQFRIHAAIDHGVRTIVDPLGTVTHWQSFRWRPFTVESWPGSVRPGPTDLADLTARNAYIDGVREALLANPDASLVWFTVATERCWRCTQHLRTAADFDRTLCGQCAHTVTPDRLEVFARHNAEYRAG